VASSITINFGISVVVYVNELDATLIVLPVTVLTFIKLEDRALPSASLNNYAYCVLPINFSHNSLTSKPLALDNSTNLSYYLFVGADTHISESFRFLSFLA
jgi:hypothetical protein